jgi:OPA family glycerol-3-phosphate transporter-like MFS transporter 3
MSKKQIVSSSDPEFTNEELSKFDFAQLLTYALCLYMSGTIGDIFNMRKLLTIAYIGMGISFIVTGLGGFYDIQSKAYFYIDFIMIGGFASILWPTYISIMANWFPKKNRGFLVGLWATCPNVGNIIGI